MRGAANGGRVCPAPSGAPRPLLLGLTGDAGTAATVPAAATPPLVIGSVAAAPPTAGGGVATGCISTTWADTPLPPATAEIALAGPSSGSARCCTLPPPPPLARRTPPPASGPAGGTMSPAPAPLAGAPNRAAGWCSTASATSATLKEVPKAPDPVPRSRRLPAPEGPLCEVSCMLRAVVLACPAGARPSASPAATPPCGTGAGHGTPGGACPTVRLAGAAAVAEPLGARLATLTPGSHRS
jgi:hypothetical protein